MSTIALARAFAWRLRANADHAEASRFSPANLSTLPVPDCRQLAQFIDDACEMATAAPMAVAMATDEPQKRAAREAVRLELSDRRLLDDVDADLYDEIIEALITAAAPAPIVTDDMVARLDEALEGEFDGLALEPETGRSILAHVLGISARGSDG